jgi:hypothetical protein
MSTVSNFRKLTKSRWGTVTVCMVMPLLAACSFGMNQNPFMENIVQTVPLDNGTTLSVGFKSPDEASSCQLVNESRRNWAVAQAVGSVKAGGGRQVLRDEATDSVKQRPQDGINYVALMIPNTTAIGVVNITPTRDAVTSYYRCVNPPKPQ